MIIKNEKLKVKIKILIIKEIIVFKYLNFDIITSVFYIFYKINIFLNIIFF